MNNFRKLKEYDNIGKDNITIFNLMDTECEFWYDGKTYKPCGWYDGSYDFLLDYYVKGIKASYRIVDNKIIPYLFITLSKEA